MNVLLLVIITVTVLLHHTLCNVEMDHSKNDCPDDRFGVQCYECHCETACDRQTGSCTAECEEGWHGPNCQMENVALNKKTRIRGYDNALGAVTVNGIRRDSKFTVYNATEVMRLGINLKKLYNINGVTIFTPANITKEGLSHMQGFEIVLSDTNNIGSNVCHYQKQPISDSGRIDTSCRGTAKNVFVRKKFPPFFLSIGEVEIYVCQAGFWGDQCQHPCNCADNEMCDPNNGVCPRGCCPGTTCKLPPSAKYDGGLYEVTTAEDPGPVAADVTNSPSSDSVNEVTTAADQITGVNDITTTVTDEIKTADEITTASEITNTVNEITTTVPETTNPVSTRNESETTTDDTMSTGSTSTSMATSSTTSTSSSAATSPTTSTSSSTATLPTTSTSSSTAATTSVSTTGTSSASVTNDVMTTVASGTTTSVVGTTVAETVMSEITTNGGLTTSTLQITPLVSDTTNVATTVSESAAAQNQDTTTGSQTTTTNSAVTTSSDLVTSAQSSGSTVEDGTASTSQAATTATQSTSSEAMSTTVLSESSSSSGTETTSGSQTTTTTAKASSPLTTESSVNIPMETSVSEITTSSDVTASPTPGIVTTTSANTTETLNESTSEGSQSISAELSTVSVASMTSDESLTTETASDTSTLGQETSSSTTGISENTASSEEPTATSESETTVPSTGSEVTMIETSSTSLSEQTSTSSVSASTTAVPLDLTSESMTVLSSESSASTSSLASTQSTMGVVGTETTSVMTDTNMTTSEPPSTTSETTQSSESTTQSSESTTQPSESTTQPLVSTVSSTVMESSSVSSTSRETTGLTGVTGTSQSTTKVPSSQGSTSQQTEVTTTQTTERTTSSGPTSQPTESTTPTTQQSSQATTVPYVTANTTAQPPYISSSTTLGTIAVPTGPDEVSASSLAAILVPSLLLFIIILAVIFSGLFILKKKKRQKMTDVEIPGNDIDLVPLTPIHNGTNGAVKKDFDDSLPYTYDEDGDLVYAGGPQGYPIPVKDIQSHVIKLQEENQFKSDYETLPDGMFLPTKDSKLDENMTKNRYTNMLAYDHSRVRLRELPAAHTDYINANYIDGFKKKKAYIATQGPLKATTSDFWSMIWQEDVRKIVMVTNLKEKNRVKCFQYWPQEKKFINCYNLRVTMESEHIFPVFVLRKIKITNIKTDDVRAVTQYHFTAWPDHGVPDAFQLLQFYRKVTGGSTEYDAQPIVVHCSAGVGRTGTYIGLDALWKEGCKTGSINILAFGKNMRKNRTKMIQTLDQYTFLHFILMEAFSNRDAAIPGSMIAKFKGMQDPKVIQRINTEFEKLNSLRPEYQATDYLDAVHRDNKSKNRSQRNLPVDNYRARLPSVTGEDSDYINAVIMPTSWNREGYLVTQYPLPSTISDFWSMVLGYQCSSIVLLDDSQDYEEKFYPALEQTAEWGRLVIQTTAVSEPQDCVTETTVNLTNTQDAIDNDEDIENETEMEVKIFTGHGWNSSSELPSEKKLVHCLHYEVQKRQTKLGEHGPVVVICRDGAKQSGLYCAVGNILDCIDWYNEVNIYHNVRQLQIRKPEIITSKNQYQYCYQVAFTYLDSGNVYENHGSTEDEIRESDYANMGEFRSSLNKDPLVKDQKNKASADQGGDLYANVSNFIDLDDPSNTELQTTI